MTYPILNATSMENTHPALHNRVIDVKSMFGTSAANVSAAFAAAESGDTLFFDHGVYSASSVALTSIDGLKLRGSPGAVIRGPGGSDPAFITFTTCDDIEITGLSFDMYGVTQYGGVKFYDCARANIHHNRFFDSAFTTSSTSDHFGIIFTHNNGGPGNTDGRVTNNIFDYTQCELNYISRFVVDGNISSNAWHTCAFGIFSTTGEAQTSTDVLFANNVVTDPVASAGAFCISIDPVTDNSNTFRRITFLNNVVNFTTSATPYRGILVGTTDNSAATSGNTFSDIIVRGNTFNYRGSTGATTAIFLNTSTTSGFTFGEVSITDNHVYANETANTRAIDLRRVIGGIVANNYTTPAPEAIVLDSCGSVAVLDNVVSASLAGFTHSSSTGNCIYRGNIIYGSPTNRYVITSVATTDRIYETVGTQMLELYDPRTSVDAPRIHLANGTTGSTASDGALVGFNNSNQLSFQLLENAHMTFYTNSSEQMRLTNGGELELDSALRWPIGAADTNIYRSAANVLKTDDQFYAAGAITTSTKAGAPSDADTALDQDGSIILDTTNHRLYVRSGGVWKYAGLT